MFQYESTHFLESAGVILFDFRDTGIDPHRLVDDHSTPNEAVGTTEPNLIFFHSDHRKKTLLPKGRRNISEPRELTALRETYEETGIKGQLLPVTLHSRATSVDPSQDRTNAAGFTRNEVRVFSKVTDPFMLTTRENAKQGIKLIWWFIGVADDVQDEIPPTLDPGCEMVSVPLSEAVETLTFENDREVVRTAIRILEDTLSMKWENESKQNLDVVSSHFPAD